MTTPDSIKRVILCLRTYQIVMPLMSVIFLILFAPIAIGFQMTIDYVRIFLPAFVVLLIWILFIEFSIHGINARKLWSWVAALIIFLFHIYSSVVKLYGSFGDPLMFGYLDYFIDLQRCVISAIGFIGVYLLLQKNIRIEFSMDDVFAKFSKRSGGDRK